MVNSMSSNKSTIAFIITVTLVIGFFISPLNPYSALIVLSGSMNPTMKVGDVILYHEVNPSDLIVGDIIVYNDPNGNTVTHRITKVMQREHSIAFQTRGDANNAGDDYDTSQSSIIGKEIISIPYLGYIPALTGNPKVFFPLIIIPALIIIGDEILTIIKYSNPINYRKLQKEKRNPTKPKKINRNSLTKKFVRYIKY